MSTPLTVWGVAAKVDEIAARYDTWGRLTSAHTIRDFDPDLPDTPIRVTFRHNPTLEIGDLVHAELDPDGRLFAVAGLDSDDLAEHEGRLFYSPDYTGYGRNMGALTFTATRASITGMSVTPRPPGFAAKASPLKMLPGDLAAASSSPTDPTGRCSTTTNRPSSRCKTRSTSSPAASRSTNSPDGAPCRPYADVTD